MSEDDKIVRLPPARMPVTLARQITRLFDPAYADLTPLQPEYDPAAEEWLRRKRQELEQPSARNDCYEWLLLLANGINGVTSDAFRTRDMAIWEQCDDLPAVVWCTATRKTVWSRTPYLPSPGEVRLVLDAHLLMLKREIAALERIAAAPKQTERWVPAPPYVPPLPPEWTKSRAVPGLGTGGENAPSLGASVRRVVAELAERKKQEEPEPPPEAA